jgi:hypothetical protein
MLDCETARSLSIARIGSETAIDRAVASGGGCMTRQSVLNRNPEALPIWPSIARITATLAIFVFHFLGLLRLDQHRLSMNALYTFAFLTGYLAQHRGVSRARWAVKRYFSVMIPYWLIIAPVLVANWLTHYKAVSVAGMLVTLAGGNLFLENPVYVITWYVTFVLLLYAYLLVDSCFAGYRRVAVSVAGYLLFSVWLGCGEYFVPFLAGMYLGGWMPAKPVSARPLWARRLARGLFEVQRVCYPFFLTHGGLQLALIRLTDWTPMTVAAVAFGGTVLIALVIHRASESLLAVVIARLDGRGRAVERVAVAV